MRPDVHRRRKRITFSKAQLTELERAFSVIQYPDTNIKDFLASLTGLPESKIQVWFQNRRARYFKSKKTQRDVSRPTTDHHHPQPTYTPSRVPTGPSPPYLPCPLGYPAPNLPQSTRALSLSAPTSPVDADQASSPCPLDGHNGLHQDNYFQSPDITDFFGGALEDFLEDPHGSQPVGTRCDVVRPPKGKQVDQGPEQHTDESMNDLSDLDLGDLSLSDLEISPEMIDYLLS